MDKGTFEQFIAFQDEIKIRRVYVEICKDLRTGAVLNYIVQKVTTQEDIFRGDEYWIIKNSQNWWLAVGLKNNEVERAIDTLLANDLIKTKKIYIDNAPRTCLAINRQQLESAIAEALDNG